MRWLRTQRLGAKGVHCNLREEAARNIEAPEGHSALLRPASPSPSSSLIRNVHNVGLYAFNLKKTVLLLYIPIHIDNV